MVVGGVPIQSMFEALVQRLLGKILGEYLQEFSAQNLKIGVWSGQVVLRNVSLRRSVIRKLNLPLRIAYSRLGTLRMTIPWKSLTSSKIEVVLEGLEVVLAELPATLWECKDTQIVEKRKRELQGFCEAVLADFAKKGERGKEGEEGYFSRLVVRILDNLQVTVRDIHIRCQDDLSKAAQSYSFGLTLEEFKLYTVNARGEPEYIDRSRPEYAGEPLRKRLQLYNIGLYWNERGEIYEEGNFGTRMASTIAKRGQPSFAHNYLILLSSQAQLLQREPGRQFVEPEVDLRIDLQTLKLEITNTQLQQIIVLAERMQRYTTKVRDENRLKLTPEEMASNREYFIRIFPEYYAGWGKNLPKADLQRVEGILEKMEVQNFTKEVSQFLQGRERERIIKERQEKNRSWWFGKPKELTAQELQEIEGYLNDNFGQEVSIIRRPPDFHFIRVTFKLDRLEVAVANNLAIIREGIEARFDQLDISFSLREGGYFLSFSMQDIGVDTFRQIGVQPREYKQILYQLNSQSKIGKEYLAMSVTGNPIDKKHLNTDIKLVTSELMLVFDPKIVSIAVEFADLRVSKENKEAALEKFGEIKEKTEAAVNETMDKPSKAQIGVDVKISAVTVAVPFSPHRPNGFCWGLNLGSIHFTTDEQTLLRVQPVENLPLDVFNFELTQFSFKHYPNIALLKESVINQLAQSNPNNALVENLDFRLKVETYGKATETQAKIKVFAIIPTLSVNLNRFTYQNLLKIGDSFQVEQKVKQQRMTARIDQKKQIQRRAAKVGFVHIKDGLTKIWKKYVAIMSENYIYLYLNKNDKDYTAYYYIKGAKLEKYTEPLDKEKPFHFRLKNKVNEVVFGFDKEEQIDDWINKIRAFNAEQEVVDRVLGATMVFALSELAHIKPPKKHELLNLFVNAEIETINVKVLTTDSADDKAIELKFSRLSSRVFLHESKKRIELNLFGLELQDSLQRYRSRELAFFLLTKRREQSENLINLEIEQLNKDHPRYDHTDSAINVSFGTLVCNYKCETVKTLMDFFLPPSNMEEDVPALPSSETEISSVNPIASFYEPRNDYENYSLKLNLKIQEISVTLVNEKIKTVLGRIGITNLNLYMGISQKRMVLIGSLKDLYFIDTTNFPRTIYKEQQSYPNERTILTANIGQNKNMLDFNIQILKQASEHQKAMLIDLQLANLTAYYVQQPVLRLITYLNTQMLPSFETGPRKPRVIEVDDSKPEPSPMELKVVLTNISVFVETEFKGHRSEQQEYMQLNIERVAVRNESVYRGYVKSAEKREIVLVENYLVQLTAMSIAVRYWDAGNRKHQYKLTNNLDLTVSTDLIAHPDYYKKELPSEFDGGLRVECAMTPFFMRTNHDDYNFVMKCLNWAITHDDGLEEELFDLPANPSKIGEEEQKEPFYLTVKMDCLSLFITHEDLPIAFLLLDGMAVDLCLNATMKMDLGLRSLYGTAIELNKTEGCLNERGVFNSLGYFAKHRMEELRDLESYFSVFDRRDRVAQNQKRKVLSCILTIREDSLDTQVIMDELSIDVDVRLLMILSTLANTDEKYISGPEPIKRINNINKVEKNEAKTPPKKMSFLFSLSKLVGSVSDRRNQKYFLIEGGVTFSMLNYGDKTKEELYEMTFVRQIMEGIKHSSMSAELKDFTVYFSKIKQGKTVAKREFLRPINISFDMMKYYRKSEEIYLLFSEVNAKIEQIILSASLKDILNINKILQDNLQILSEFKSEKPAEEKPLNQQDFKKQVRNLEERLVKEIQPKTRLIASIGHMQVEVVNDCDNNFMPVLRLLIEATSPAMNQSPVQTEFFIVPIISLYFFNPRSSRWEPILEPFKAFINFNSFPVGGGKSSLAIKTAGLGEETSSLKLNISTQMLSTIMATKDILYAEKENIEKNIETKEIEVSPYIFFNITNEKIYLIRGQSEFELNPMFKGPIRITDKDNKISFRLRNQTHKFSLDHYGVLKIPNSDYFIKFDTEKLNRIIKFLPLLVMKNRLHQPIYIKRFGRVPELPKKIEKNEPIPLDNVDSLAVSLNGNSYTERVSTAAFKLTGFLLAEKKNFVILLKYKQRIDRFTFVNLLSPMIVYNCLPKQLSVQFIQKAKTKSTSTINAQQSYSVFSSEDLLQLELKLYVAGYSWSTKFRYHPENEGEAALGLEDEDGCVTTLNYVFKKNRNTNQFILIVYCKKIIVNELNDKLLVYGCSQRREKGTSDVFQLLGGQVKDRDEFDEKVMMAGDEVGDVLRVCGSRSIVDFATPIPIGGIGSSQCRIVVDREQGGRRQSLFTVLGVEISPVRMMKECDIFCKKIVLRSRSIIINHSKRDLFISEEAVSYQFVCEAGCKKNLTLSMPGIEGRRYRYRVTADGLKESRAITLPEQGSAFFKLESREELDMKGRKKLFFFKVFVQAVESYVFYEFSEIAREELPYEIVIKSSSLRARVPDLNINAVHGEDCSFFNESEADQHLVNLVVSHCDSGEEISVAVRPDDLRFYHKDLVQVQKGGLVGSVAVCVRVTVRDSKRTIVVDELTRLDPAEQVEQSSLVVELAEIVLSINQNSEAIEVPFESMVVTLRRLLFIKYETDKRRQFQLKLGFLQIDQAFPFLISSPVILTPAKFEEFTRETDPRSIFNFTIIFSKQFVRNTFISEVAVDFDDLVATFSADFINLASAIYSEFTEVINDKESKYAIDKRSEKWMELKVPPEGKNVFIKSIRIAPFVIDLSAELNIKKLKLQNQFLKTFLSTFGIVMSNIDAPIEMTGIEINDCIDTVDSITNQLMAHYKRTCVNQIYKLFGSLNIIGNPLGLFRDISTGVRDLKEKPAQGFVNGPAQFGMGIVQGTGSLLAHSVGGAFGSIAKVTGTFSTGLATLAFDKDFEEHREKEKMKKPQNVIQGLAKGGKAVLYGFKEGFTGVFTQPIENAKREGALGFVKGAAKGLAGLVVKPVTGIIDFASKTTEGIKNNALMFEDKAHQQRMRYPRVFYTECFILKEYSRRDSQLYSIMRKMENEQKFQNPIFVASYETNIENQFLVILQDSVVYLDIKDRSVKWAIDFGALQMENNSERRMLFLKRKGKGVDFFNVDFDVEIDSEEARQEIVEVVDSLIKERNHH